MPYYPAETVEQIRNQVSLSALEGLIIHMGSLKEGRKALILVSEGYSDIAAAAAARPDRRLFRGPTTRTATIRSPV